MLVFLSDLFDTHLKFIEFVGYKMLWLQWINNILSKSVKV